MSKTEFYSCIHFIKILKLSLTKWAYQFFHCGGYIQIDKIDKDNAKLVGGFSGIFHEDTAPEGVNVELSGAFNVILE